MAQLHAQQASPQESNYGHMRVINPLGQTQPPTPAQISASPITDDNTQQTAGSPPAEPAILDLASNYDLNVATIAREAKRSRKQPPSDEVVIPLR